MRIGLPKDFHRYLSYRGTSVLQDEEAEHQPLTLRALGIGSFLSLFLAVAGADPFGSLPLRADLLAGPCLSGGG